MTGKGELAQRREEKEELAHDFPSLLAHVLRYSRMIFHGRVWARMGLRDPAGATLSLSKAGGGSFVRDTERCSSLEMRTLCPLRVRRVTLTCLTSESEWGTCLSQLCEVLRRHSYVPEFVIRGR